MDDQIQQRKEKIISFVTHNKDFLLYFILIAIVIFTFMIRTSNIPLFSNEYLPDVDSYLFYRYAQDIVEDGSLTQNDTLRYYPLGFDTTKELMLTSHAIAWTHRVLSIFSPSITIFQSTVIYPPIFFALGLFAFFFLVKKLFNSKTALIATAFLSVIPIYLYRTMAGVSDKEPFAIFLMYIVLLLFVSGLQAQTNRKTLIYGIASGIATGILGLTWAGVAFVTLTIAVFTLFEIFLDKFTKKDLYLYIPWLLVFLFMVTVFTNRYGSLIMMLKNFIFSIPIFVLLVIGFDYLIRHRNFLNLRVKTEKALPSGLVSLILTGLLAFIAGSIMFGFSFFTSQIRSLLNSLIFFQGGSTRFQLTVAEGAQPYFTTWISNMGWVFFLLFFLSSIWLFYNWIKPLSKHRIKLMIGYIATISGLIFTRYHPSTIFNGSSTISRLFYGGAILLFLGVIAYVYLHSYHKDKEVYKQFTSLHKRYLLVIIFFFLMVVSTRGAIRLFFTLSPVICILAGYGIGELWDWLLKTKEKALKYGLAIVIIVILYFTLYNFVKIDIPSAQSTGPSFGIQWQNAMNWVQNNTASDAVFAHWWDYGYWIQTMGDRATVTDGGNLIVYWNHLMGRYFLTGHDEKEALELFKTHGVTHALIVSEEIGKYPAYSSIGGDINNDRYSYLGTFVLDPSQITETRNQTVYVFRGGYSLDEDFIYNDIVFPGGVAAIGAIALPIVDDTANQSFTFTRPTAFIAYNGQTYQVPLSCIFFDGTIDGIDNGREYTFGDAGLKGCFRIIPSISIANGGQSINGMGAGIYVSERVRPTLFTKLYLYGQETESFKLAYSDSSGVPLSLFQNTVIGPIKIWKITYPEDIKPNPEYLRTEFPDERLNVLQN